MRKIAWSAALLVALSATSAHAQACVNGVKLSNFTPCTFSGLTFTSGSVSVSAVTPSSLAPTDFRVVFVNSPGMARIRLEAWLGNGAYVHNNTYPNPVGGTYQNFNLLVGASNATNFSYRVKAALSFKTAAGRQLDSIAAQGLGTGSVFGDMAYAYVNCQTNTSTVCGAASATNTYGFAANTASGPGTVVGSLTATAAADGINGTRDPCSAYAGNYTGWQGCASGKPCTYLGHSYFGYDRCDLDVIQSSSAGWLGNPWTPSDGVTDGTFFIDSDLSATAGVYYNAAGNPVYLSAGAQTDGVYEVRIFDGTYVAPPVVGTVPEPATPLLAATGLALAWLVRRRRA